MIELLKANPLLLLFVVSTIVGGPLIVALIFGWLERSGPIVWNLPYDMPNIGYAIVYPLATILAIVAAQLLLVLLN